MNGLSERDVEQFRKKLLEARDALERHYDEGQGELDEIDSDHEIEWEEHAQEVQTADVRTRLSAAQFAQLRSIDGALERMDRGIYGRCIECGHRISRKRLQAEPWAATCETCAAGREEGDATHREDPADRPQDRARDVPDAVGDEHLRGPALPPELAALDDREVAEIVRDAFRTEVGEALDDVRIVCRHGRVILAGEVANEQLPEIARRIVEDEVGYEVVDRMLVTDSAGGPEAERREAGSRHPVPEETLSIDEDDIEDEFSDDLHETEQEGLVYVPPTRPVPER